jgi:preprotein translocase subunit SecG
MLLLKIILVLMIIVAILLIVIILIQNPKGGGISSEFGGGATSQMFGVQRTGDIMEQLTWGFFAFLIVGALGTGIISKMNGGAAAADGGLNVERATTAPSALPTTTPPAQTAPATQPATVPAK